MTTRERLQQQQAHDRMAELITAICPTDEELWFLLGQRSVEQFITAIDARGPYQHRSTAAKAAATTHQPILL